MTTGKTEKLYDESPYDSTFQAEIKDIIKDDNGTALILDRTLFFPESGGQVADKGTIRVGDASYDVIDVQIKDDVIYHYIAVVGDDFIQSSETGHYPKIEGEIDFAYRFSNMQQHTGEHIFSGLAKRYYNCTNVGFHLSETQVTFDYDIPLTSEQILHLETEVNKVIYENRVVKAYYPDEQELLNADYRSKKDIEGDVRLVEIEGIDLCACCAPHVRRTGEIGICKVVDYMNYKGGVRISILCGERALMYYRELDDITRDIGRALSAKREDIGKELDRVNAELAEAKNKRIDFEKKYLDLIFDYVSFAIDNSHISHIKNENMIDELMDEHIISDEAVILYLDEIDTKALRDTVNRLKEKYQNRLTGIMVKSDTGYSYIMGSVELDCKSVASILRDEYKAKGGGSSDMIQGSIDYKLTASDIAGIYEGARNMRGTL